MNKILKYFRFQDFICIIHLKNLFKLFKTNTKNEMSLSFESASISLPKAKRQRREIPKEFLCNGNTSNGNQCSFASLKGSMYCKRHIPKATVSNIGTNTPQDSIGMVDSSTNTEDNMLDLITANKLILELIDDRVEHEKQITELLEIYRLYQSEFEQLQLV